MRVYVYEVFTARMRMSVTSHYDKVKIQTYRIIRKKIMIAKPFQKNAADTGNR